jgi:tetratricopeptide (TPR) repeat protein
LIVDEVIMLNPAQVIPTALKHVRKLPTLFLAIALSFPLCAQVTPYTAVSQAANLNGEGKFAEASQTISSFFAQDPPNNDALTGVAWNIRGLALQNLGDMEGARRSYESSVAILHDKPDQIDQYASALDNLGSLKADLGQLQESRSLRNRAIQLYRSAGDQVGAARVSINLAILAVGMRDHKHARQYLADAVKAESLLPEPAVGDLAALDAAQAINDYRDGRLNPALDEINRAIAFWTEGYGPRYYRIATGLFLRGHINDLLHRSDNARADFKLSLDILRENHADPQVFFIVEKAYAEALRDFGERAEADRLQSDADHGIETLNRQQCKACSISAASFR